jgi:hypothetical protein
VPKGYRHGNSGRREPDDRYLTQRDAVDEPSRRHTC